MKIHSVSLRNFGPFELLEETRLGPFSTIVGRNDAGKSSILRALDIFLAEKPKLQSSDIHAGSTTTGPIEIEVAFEDLPSALSWEKGVQTTFAEENLLDTNGYLRLRMTFPRDELSKPTISLLTTDFVYGTYSSLWTLREADLNARCESVGLDVTKAGRGVTNKGKRSQLRSRASDSAVGTGPTETTIAQKDEFWKCLSVLLPRFILFQSDTRLGVAETSFQSEFRPIVEAAAAKPEVELAKSNLTTAIEISLQAEIDKLFVCLGRYTDSLVSLTVRPTFAWQKAVTFDLLGSDRDGVKVSLENRGTGLRRLLMVAFFQYLVEKAPSLSKNYVFAIEEPENCLHPGLQRELTRSFRAVSEQGSQILVTSHSPVFAGASPVEDLTLIVRTKGVAHAIRYPVLELSRLADELGVEPSDQITAYDACVFVEGSTDVKFFRTVAVVLRDAKKLSADGSLDNVGFVPVGGDNLKHWIDLRAMSRLNRRFAVIVDSDRQSPTDVIPGRTLTWKKKCEAEGGRFFVLRKREIENYIHRAAIRRAKLEEKAYDDFADMKALFGPGVSKLIDDMTADEILEMDTYLADGVPHNELKELVEELLELA